MKNKQKPASRRLFFRTVRITAVVLFCLWLGVSGIALAYENTRRIGFGEYRRAVEFDGKSLWVLDFELPLA